MKAISRWKQGFQSENTDGRGHSLILDLPKGKGGKDLGTSALELTAMGLAGCISTIFAMVAKKIRLEFTALEVDLEAHKGEKDPTISKVDFVLKIKTEDSLAKVEKCLALTENSCPVGVIFENAGIPVNSEIKML